MAGQDPSSHNLEELREHLRSAHRICVEGGAAQKLRVALQVVEAVLRSRSFTARHEAVELATDALARFRGLAKRP